jgi:hypothetical protein
LRKSVFKIFPVDVFYATCGYDIAIQSEERID